MIAISLTVSNSERFFLVEVLRARKVNARDVLELSAEDRSCGQMREIKGRNVGKLAPMIAPLTSMADQMAMLTLSKVGSVVLVAR